MPQYQQTLSVPAQTASEVLALSHGAFQHLGWLEELSVDQRLVGCTKKTWQGPHDYILVDAADDSLTVTGRLPQNARWDPFKKNKKNVTRFLAAFDEVRSQASAEQVAGWQQQVSAFQEQSAAALEKQQQEAAEAEAVMNLASGSRTLTYTLIGINVLLFIAMVASGVHFFEPKIVDLVKWGANYKPLTTGGEWWRLLTSTFIHIGIIHLAFNMYALFQAGYYLEPMLGKGRFLAAYLCTGLLASVSSTLFHGSETVGAGASGAIFGLYGVFLALLTTKLIPQSIRKPLLQSIGIFVFYNLAYGARSQAVDNSAHLGGLVSGLLIGYLYFFSFQKQRFRPAIAMGVAISLTALLSFSLLRSTSQDGALYQKKVDEVLKIQDTAMAPFKSFTSDADLLSKLARVAQPEWAKAKTIMAETEHYRLDDTMAKHRKLLKEYIDLRIRYNDLSIMALQGHEKVDGELEALAKEINDKVQQMQGQGTP